MNRIRDLRTLNCLKLKDLSKALDITFQSLSYYELGQRQPDYNTAVKIADYFDVTLDYLLGRVDKNITAAPPAATTTNFMSDEDSAFLAKFRRLDDWHRRRLDVIIDTFLGDEPVFTSTRKA